MRRNASPFDSNKILNRGKLHVVARIYTRSKPAGLDSFNLQIFNVRKAIADVWICLVAQIMKMKTVAW